MRALSRQGKAKVKKFVDNSSSLTMALVYTFTEVNGNFSDTVYYIQTLFMSCKVKMPFNVIRTDSRYLLEEDLIDFKLDSFFDCGYGEKETVIIS